MLEQIEHRESALQHAHDDLERRVDKRTRQLQDEIGERKRAEQALEDRKAFLNSLIENIPVAIVAVIDNDTLSNVQPGLRELCSFIPRKPSLGTLLAHLVTNSELRAELESNRKSLARGHVVHLVTRRCRSDGSLVDVEVFSVPLGRDGNRIGGFAALSRHYRTQTRRGRHASRQGSSRSSQSGQK